MIKPLFFLISIFFSITCFSADSVMQVIPLNNRPASELQPLIKPFLENSERIIANSFSLIIKATPSRQQELKSLINQLDKRLNNLTITVVQSKTKTAQALNAQAQFGVNFTTNKSSNISIKARGRYDNINNVNNSDSQQQIKTLDGKTAYIKTGKSHPIENISIQYSRNNFPVISKNVQYIEATSGFLVTPRLSGKQVILEVSPWSDKMQNNGVLSSQSGHTTVRVNLGQWIEIGGINEKNQQSTNGTFSHTYSTTNKSMRVLIKVEKTN